MHFATKQREQCVFCIGRTPASLHPRVLSDGGVLVMRLTRTPSGVGLQQTDIVSAITIWNAVPLKSAGHDLFQRDPQSRRP